MKRLLSALAPMLMLAHWASAQPPSPMPYPGVPPPRVEVVPPPPGGRYVWEPGHWHWNGVAYAWMPGRYVVRHPHYAQYVPGHWRWAPHRGAWVWQPAHWQ